MKDHHKNAGEIRRLILERKESLRAFAEISRFLVAKGIAKPLADEILLEMHQKIREDHTLERFALLKTLISQRIRVANGCITEERPSIAALVGPTGVGKTTTVLKLASFYGHQYHKKVGLISLDKEKGGAFQQLEKYASQWKMPLYEGLESVFALDDQDLILIDTTGCNFYQRDRVASLAEMVASLRNLTIHLTLSAATKEVDLYGAIHQFSTLPLTSLIFTKLDETLSAGVLINIASKVEIPYSYIAYGYPLPGEIQVADPSEIAHKILTDFNEKNFHFLRQLVIYD